MGYREGAAELLELFQWEPPVVDLTKIEHEIADIVIYLTYFCEAADINLDKIVQDKILINDFNYPVENNNGVCNRLKEVVL